jgi:hypothetical protein
VAKNYLAAAPDHDADCCAMRERHAHADMRMEALTRASLAKQRSKVDAQSVRDRVQRSHFVVLFSGFDAAYARTMQSATLGKLTLRHAACVAAASYISSGYAQQRVL